MTTNNLIYINPMNTNWPKLPWKSVLKQGKFSDNLGEVLVSYIFYTFKLLPQLKTGRSETDKGDFFSQIAP